MGEFINCILNGEIPDTFGYSMFSIGEGFQLREKCTRRGMWAIVTNDRVSRLADWIGNRTCVEVMAGAGWLAKALDQNGTDVVATDDFSWGDRHTDMKMVFPVEKLSALDAIEKYKKRDILIVSWPPYGDSTVCRVCEKWKGLVVYIGESKGGCNAPDEFFSNFNEIEDVIIPMPRWPGMHDTVSVGYYSKVRKK